MSLKVVLVAICLAAVECVDRGKLSSTPPAQTNFNVDKWLGDWYYQARLLPCSWSGSAVFTNYVSQHTLTPSGTVEGKHTWWNEGCSSVPMALTPKGTPGVFMKKDPLGDVTSGTIVIVATDYKKFVINWGCSDQEDGYCVDPRVTVKTRQQNPSPHTWKIIESILDHYWKLSLSEMVRVIHDQNACVKLDAPIPKGPGHLRKTY